MSGVQSAVPPVRTAAAAGWASARHAVLNTLTLWHLCSLDAPTIAVLWAMLIAWSSELYPRAAAFAVLALGTWIVYVLDRLLDGFGGGEALQARHHFHHRHRRVLLWLCAVATLVLAGFCWESALRRLVCFYLCLGIPVTIYALRVHSGLLNRGFTGGRFARWAGGQDAPFAGGKEVSVAVLFTSAVIAPAFTAAGSKAATGPGRAAMPEVWLQLLVTASLMAGLCLLNCVFISHAEVPGGRTAAGIPDRRIARGSLLLSILAAAALGEAVVRSGVGGGAGQAPRAAIVLAALLLRALLAVQPGRHGGRTDAQRLRILADVALLTPAPFLLVHLGHGSWTG